MPQQPQCSLNLAWAQWMVEELYRLGCRRFYMGCGSRSTPLTVAAARQIGVEATLCYDERGAAFRALGYARATGQAAVVVTTSGTAVANCMPAVVEASQDGIPLLIFTADRPPELLDTGANQAIDQTRFFGTTVRWQFELPCATAEIDPAFLWTTLDQAVYRCHGLDPGPVHLNWQIREPFLSGLEPQPQWESLRTWQAQDTPWTTYTQASPQLDDETLSRLSQLIQQTEKGLLMVGRLDNDCDRQAVRDLIHRLNWPVYADLTSGLRLAEVGTHMMRHFDQELMEKSFSESCRPQVVLHLGGRITSKRVGLYFQEYRPDHYLVVQDTPRRYDPIHCVTERIQASVAHVASQLVNALEQKLLTDWSQAISVKAQTIQEIIAKSIESESSLSEPYVTRRVSEMIPEGTALFVSNSMPIRDVDLYGTANRSDIKVAANRGASGIDGIVATALGWAEGNDCVTTLLIGDMALIHDSSSLSMLASCKTPVIIIAINNHGSGIFRFLPIAQEEDVFQEYFLAPHACNFQGLAQTFGCDYALALTKTEFDQAYQTALAQQKQCLIEVEVDGQESFALRKSMKQKILALFDPTKMGDC